MNSYRWVGLTPVWTFRAIFTLAQDDPLLKCSNKLLVCEGLDTIASITLNGSFVGSSDNQFRRFVFPVQFKSGENTLQVAFESAALYADKMAAHYPYIVPDGFAPEQFGEKNRNFIRKEQVRRWTLHSRISALFRGIGARVVYRLEFGKIFTLLLSKNLHGSQT